MLRSVLATAFVAALAFGVTAGQGAEDITWGAPSAESAPTAQAAVPGDITWGVGPGPGDITWDAVSASSVA